MDIELPELLAPYKEVIESTLRPAVLFRAELGPTRPRQSKLGGAPYFPASANPDVPDRFLPGMAWTPWPKHPRTGEALQMLIQLDFSEMPRLEPFPTSGILQIFVDDQEWHEVDRHLRAVYHPNVDEDPYDFGDVELGRFRVPESALCFELDAELITPSDYRFGEVYAAPAFAGRSFEDLDRETNFALHRCYLSVTDHRYENVGEVGRGRNKIGGYHYSQNGKDPRVGREEWRDSTLLVQLQDYDRLSWGDGGSAQLFIKSDDLKNRDFSDLLFHWDST